MELKDALTIALDDEYKARATYGKVLEKFGDVFPFVNIIEAEERHIRALDRLFERYELPVPADDWPARVDVPRSVQEALAAGVEAERENGALYDRLIEATRAYPDVVETFRRLKAASQENHLPAFERALGRDGEGRGGGGGRRHRRRGHSGA